MKTKDIKELHQKTEGELVKMLQATTGALMSAKFNKVQNKLKNTRELFHLGKNIARMQTILKEKEILKNV